MKIRAIALVAFGFVSHIGAADTLSIALGLVDTSGSNLPAGRVLAFQTKYGVVFQPDLHGLPPGLHGFHVHENPSCQPKAKDGKMVAALGAGGHLDPLKTGVHGTPWGNGHLGDLPALYVDMNGMANQPVLAPRLKLSDLSGRSLMIHTGADNHSDHPMPLGGGGARMVCGVIP